MKIKTCLKGQEVAWDEFVLQKGKFSKTNPAEGENLEIIEDDATLTIKNDKVDLKINDETGEIESWMHQGKVITNQAIRPNF